MSNILFMWRNYHKTVVGSNHFYPKCIGWKALSQKLNAFVFLSLLEVKLIKTYYLHPLHNQLILQE